MKKLADSLYPKFLEMCKKFPSKPCRIFLATSDMKTRAIVRHASADTPEDAWKSALEKLSDAVKSAKIKPKILKADFVTTREQLTFAMLIRRIKDIRRNYFRQGIAFDLDYNIVFTEQEINSNLMLYKPGETLESKNGEYRQENFEAYCQERFGTSMPKLTDSTPIEIFDTAGIFIEEGKEPLKITGIGNDAGHRDLPNITGEFVLDIAKSCAGYLASLVNKKGRFTYGLWPCVDKPVPKYNTPRHFSTLYAMLGVQEMYGAMGSIRLGKAIQSGVQYGVDKFTRYRTLENGEEAAYFEDIDQKEFKLGASGIALITLARYTNQMHTKKYIPLMRAAARGIISMQKDDGSFVHVLNSTDFSLKNELRTVFYDGEAVFGLLRLYAITKDQWLLDAAEKAFEHFLEIDHWKNHDHWLSYAVNEITIYKPEARYFEFGIKNFKDFLPFIYHRETGYPTLLELTMAADDMLERMKKMPEMQDLLSTVDFDFFYSAIEERTRILLNTYLFPEVAMYFKRPESIVKGSYIRHHACRVRIDEVAHLVAGFANCSKFYKRREAEKKLETKSDEKTAAIFYAGTVNPKGNANFFSKVSELQNSDFRIVNSTEDPKNISDSIDLCVNSNSEEHFIKAGDFSIAVLSSSMPADQPEVWKNEFAGKIENARTKSDAVIISTQWSLDNAENARMISRILIDLGADAVLNCHGENAQGIEVYKNRPIVYDAGKFVADLSETDDGSVKSGGCFQLTLSKTGLKNIRFISTRSADGWVEKSAGDQVLEDCGKFITRCSGVGTKIDYKSCGYPELDLTSADDNMSDKYEPLIIIENNQPAENKKTNDINKNVEVEKSMDEVHVDTTDIDEGKPLRVGVMRMNKNGFWHPQNTTHAMFYTAKQFNIDLCLFSPEDVNFETKTVKAEFLVENKRVVREVPIPRIIENSVSSAKGVIEFINRLENEAGCFLTRHPLIKTKQQVYDMLLAGGKFKEFLIESHIINSFEQFLDLLGKYYDDVILKPLRGARGIGVARISRKDDRFLLNFLNQKADLNLDEFRNFYDEHFTSRKHILQPYIVSRTQNGNPFDIRVHCRRGAGGKFKVSPFPRIGNAAGVVSNIATGGYSMKLDTFLQVEFGDDWQFVLGKLQEFGSSFPDYYQSFYKVPVFDIGVDMGIQKRDDHYDFKIFEVNTYIDGPFFEIEDAITYFEYFKYIDQKLKQQAK